VCAKLCYLKGSIVMHFHTTHTNTAHTHTHTLSLSLSHTHTHTHFTLTDRVQEPASREKARGDEAGRGEDGGCAGRRWVVRVVYVVCNVSRLFILSHTLSLTHNRTPPHTHIHIRTISSGLAASGHRSRGSKHTRGCLGCKKPIRAEIRTQVRVCV
jgi:hypothetical protein